MPELHNEQKIFSVVCQIQQNKCFGPTVVCVNGVCYVVVFAFSKPHLIDNLSDHKYALETCVGKTFQILKASNTYANIEMSSTPWGQVDK